MFYYSVFLAHLLEMSTMNTLGLYIMIVFDHHYLKNLIFKFRSVYQTLLHCIVKWMLLNSLFNILLCHPLALLGHFRISARMTF